MKKTYIIPTMASVQMAYNLPIAASGNSPQVSVDKSKSVDAGSVDVKGTNNYDVWNDDWNASK